MNATNSTNATSPNATSAAAAPKKKSKKSEEESLAQNASLGVNMTMAQNENATGGVNGTNTTANKTKKPKLPSKPADLSNQAYKESKFIKTTTYPIGANEILLRITNLDDRFDGKTNEDYIYFDVNTFAREMYLEANEKNMSKSQKKQALVTLVKLEIEEMNIAGSIGLSDLNSSDRLTSWKVNKTEDPPKSLIQKPKDKVHDVKLAQRTSADNPGKDPFERVNVVALEPQRIRTFRIKYIMPIEKFEKKKPLRIVDQKNATAGTVYYDEIPKSAFNVT